MRGGALLDLSETPLAAPAGGRGACGEGTGRRGIGGKGVGGWDAAGGGTDAQALDILADMVEHHLLPRFALLSAIAAAHRYGPGFWPRTLATGAVLACAGAAAAMAWCGHLPRAWFPAAAAYLVLGCAALFLDRAWSLQWLLRIPAAAAVGLIVLVTVNPYWWQNADGEGPTPAALTVLFGASCGYLLIQVRNHGLGPRPWARRRTRPGRTAVRALGRVLAVAALGAAHSFLVALVGLAVLVPAFSENGRDLAAVLAGDAVGPAPGTILALATAWCLASGVFSQILWDDRPITAPLAHHRWHTPA